MYSVSLNNANLLIYDNIIITFNRILYVLRLRLSVFNLNPRQKKIKKKNRIIDIFERYYIYIFS